MKIETNFVEGVEMKNYLYKKTIFRTMNFRMAGKINI